MAAEKKSQEDAKVGVVVARVQWPGIDGGSRIQTQSGRGCAGCRRVPQCVLMEVVEGGGS